jgi:hypothetical protein
MLLLGVDLMRMHCNKPYLQARDDKHAHPKGFWSIFKTRGAVSDELLDKIYDLTDLDLLRIATTLATLLVTEELVESPDEFKALLRALSDKDPINHAMYLNAFEYTGEEKPPVDFTAQLTHPRDVLVRTGSSIPAETITPVLCVSAEEWLLEKLPSCLSVVVFITAAMGVLLATYACSDGVLQVALAGFTQATAVLAFMVFLGCRPAVSSAAYAVRAAGPLGEADEGNDIVTFKSLLKRDQGRKKGELQGIFVPGAAGKSRSGQEGPGDAREEGIAAAAASPAWAPPADWLPLAHPFEYGRNLTFYSKRIRWYQMPNILRLFAIVSWAFFAVAVGMSAWRVSLQGISSWLTGPSCALKPSHQ